MSFTTSNVHRIAKETSRKNCTYFFFLTKLYTAKNNARKDAVLKISHIVCEISLEKKGTNEYPSKKQKHKKRKG